MATASSNKSKTNTSKGKKRPLPKANEPGEIIPLLLPSLYRLTEGLPRRELKLMVSEAMISEEALEKDIEELQEALENPDAPLSPAVAEMLELELTPLDRYFTVSALLGRLRDDLATPLPPNSALPALRAKTGLLQPPKKKTKKDKDSQPATNPPSTNASTGATGSANTDAKTSGDSVGVTASTTTSDVINKNSPPLTTLEKQKRVLSLYQSPEYAKEHSEPATLLAVWKKISAHRSSIVFRRPVNPKEAPGYAERIRFPMDLSLIRKMIVARQIKSYSQLHQRLGLICHNCMKYNGRESDYGVVTRNFEAVVDEVIVSSVSTATELAQQQPLKAAAQTPAPKSSSTNTVTATATPKSTAPAISSSVTISARAPTPIESQSAPPSKEKPVPVPSSPMPGTKAVSNPKPAKSSTGASSTDKTPSTHAESAGKKNPAPDSAKPATTK